MIYRGKRNGIIPNFTLDIDPGYKYFEKFRGGVHWYMMHSKDFLSNISFELRKKNNQIVSLNVQSITFRLSISEILSLQMVIIKSRFFPNKHKLKIRPELKNFKCTLPPNLQIFKQKLLSGSGLVEYK